MLSVYVYVDKYVQEISTQERNQRKLSQYLDQLNSSDNFHSPNHCFDYIYKNRRMNEK